MNEPASKKRVGVDRLLHPHDTTCQSHTLIPTSHPCTSIFFFFCTKHSQREIWPLFCAALICFSSWRAHSRTAAYGAIKASFLIQPWKQLELLFLLLLLLTKHHHHRHLLLPPPRHTQQVQQYSPPASYSVSSRIPVWLCRWSWKPWWKGGVRGEGAGQLPARGEAGWGGREREKIQ